MIDRVTILKGEARTRGSLTIIVRFMLALILAALPVVARANCTTVSTTEVDCDSSEPNPFTSTIGSGRSAAAGTTVTLGTDAQVVPVGNLNAISLGDNATINVGSGVLVQNVGTCCGLYGTGTNTVEFNNNSTLTIAAGGKVYSAGNSMFAEAVNPQGNGNVIDNFGTIQADRAFAIYFNGFGTNTLINEAGGVIQGPSTTAGVIGANGALNFTNKGQVIGSLTLTGRSDQLHLYTGSGVTGSISGSGGTDALTLNGTGSGMLASAISNFETLTK